MSAHIEVERKFLVRAMPAGITDYPKKSVSQGYISVSPVIRIRRMDDECFLTIKQGAGLVKEEYETEITHEQFAALSKKVDHAFIEKDRYYVPLEEGRVAELDVYLGRLDGLLTVEVEFDNARDAERFKPPIWFGKDVTDERGYGNASLALYGKPCC